MVSGCRCGIATQGDDPAPGKGCEPYSAATAAAAPSAFASAPADDPAFAPEPLTTEDREALRLRPQVLRRLGWHYIRVHAFDLYSDPAGVAERIAAILGVAPEGGAVDTVTQPIDVLD